MGREPSTELYIYLGKLEVIAHSLRGDARYWYYSNALESLHSQGLSEEDSRLAKDILRRKEEDYKPWNIGCASGEAGEAD